MLEDYKFFTSLLRLARRESDLHYMLHCEAHTLFCRIFYFGAESQELSEFYRKQPCQDDVLSLPAA